MSPSAPWLSHDHPGVPATLAPQQDRTLVDYLEDHARERPCHPALLFKGATVTYADLREFCRGTLAPRKIPSTVEFRTELPKTLVGNVLRRALKDEERADPAGASASS
jgi:acyl-CoA synthetase (AMP-forming)/AMP-acid ligase II